jgi:hypothetical protein
VAGHCARGDIRKSTSWRATRGDRHVPRAAVASSVPIDFEELAAMKTLVMAIAIALPATAVADRPAATGESGFHARLFERYCDKLRESPEAYVQFVRRMQTVHGLTYADFAPDRPDAPVRADCHAAPERVAAVNRIVGSEKR